MSSSKQLNFFITSEDYNSMDSFLKECSALILVNDNTEKQKNINISINDLNEDIKQIFLTKKDFLDKVIIKTIDDISYYYITASLLLEFSLGGFFPYDKNSLQSGRFYYIKAYYDENGDSISKSEDFTSWCDEIFRKFKKIFLKKYSNNCYCSESAIKWIELNNAVLNNGGQQWSKR
ncbi:hypothetical protein ACHRV5_03355 [Flavobacterium sp. FlaQc-52]|jgi:hypothetical protein|uniref:hypothetical protein n=1 Tax=Flavobacterium sp. FlaQc-52 TaxID=3374185 RepID=UPI0037567C62